MPLGLFEIILNSIFSLRITKQLAIYTTQWIQANNLATRFPR